MALKLLAFALTVTASPLVAAQAEPGMEGGAPTAGPDAKYCMRVELTGNIVEPVRCWTRDKWSDQGVDVDKEWAANGVRVLEV